MSRVEFFFKKNQLRKGSKTKNNQKNENQIWYKN